MRYFGILALVLLLSSHVLGQESAFLEKITLKTGDVYVGEVVVKTTNMVMIKLQNGTRYQFPLTEVLNIETTATLQAHAPSNSQTTISQSEENISGQSEFSIGTSTANGAFSSVPNAQVSLTFGNKKMFNKNLFVGLGVGYNISVLNSSAFGLIPIFLRIQSVLNTSKTSPYIGMDAGYALSTTATNFSGGPLVRLSIGISHRLSYKTSIIAGIYAGVNSISGKFLFTNELGTYTGSGTTSVQQFGVKTGLVF